MVVVVEEELFPVLLPVVEVEVEQGAREALVLPYLEREDSLALALLQVPMVVLAQGGQCPT